MGLGVDRAERRGRTGRRGARPGIFAREEWLRAAAFAALAGCAPAPTGAEPAPTGPLQGRDYLGVETRLLDGDLVDFLVAMKDAAEPRRGGPYAECAASQYALIRGYGFARHVRTKCRKRVAFGAEMLFTPSRPYCPTGSARWTPKWWCRTAASREYRRCEVR